MKKVTVSQEVKNMLPGLILGCIECDVIISEENSELWLEIESTCGEIGHSGDLAEVGSHPAIKASRLAYRRCGKDPARYRLSSEALMRRVIKGHQLYRINNIVDLVNLVSLKTGMSIGGYDVDKIRGDVVFDIGKKDEPYEAIGRGEMNIAALPVFRDDLSPFGSPTSDSVRTSVTAGTKRFLMIIVGFCGSECTTQSIGLSVRLLEKYAGAQNIEIHLANSGDGGIID